MSPLGREGVAGREDGCVAGAFGWESGTWERCDWRGAERADRGGMLGSVSGGRKCRGQMETYSDKIDIQYNSVAGKQERTLGLRESVGSRVR